MSDAIERAARTLFLSDRSDTLPAGFPERQWDEGHAVKDDYIRRARALADAGLLAAAPLREDGAGWYEVIHPSRATTHIAYVHEDGSIYFPEGDYPLSEHEFAFAAATGRAHRLVRADTVDPAEGDGRAVTHE